MKMISALIAGLLLSTVSSGAQGKTVFVINQFTTAPDVKLPYDLKQLQASAVAEFGVMLKDWDIVAEKPATAGTVYILNVKIERWAPGNAAKRLLVGLGAGREAADIEYSIKDSSGKSLLEHKDTIRTNFFNQGAGSTGTLAHPFAQKITERIKDAKLARK